MTGTAKLVSDTFRWSFGRAEFDESRWTLSLDGSPVELERRPLQVLGHLLRHAGEVRTKDELLEAAWSGRVVVEASLTNAIAKLRRALGDESQQWIVTVPRVGYRLQGAVSRKAIARVPVRSRLVEGEAVPRRPNWRLATALSRYEDSEVWLARHAKTREERVFKFSLDGSRLSGLKREVTLSRLLHESLGEQDHFVRLLDWDFDDAPYFLESEYGGPDLTRWLETVSPGSDRAVRLDLMAQAAEAVAQAHEVGILHKDLKPTNLLVDGTLGAWCLKVVDFGSGRLLDPARLEALGITRLGATQLEPGATDSTGGTPLYLAPEVTAGQASTLKSDLYSLGVILYQLLVGDFRRPMSPGWEADIDDEMLRRDIADFANGDPTRRPSSARELAERLRMLPERRQRLALEKAVQDRIAANEKRLAKAKARRPFLVIAIALLVAGMAVTLQMYGRVRDAQELALLERDTAVALNRFVTHDILAATDPMRSGREGMTMREALDVGASRISTRFANQPALAGPMHEAVAGAYYQLSLYDAAHRHFNDAADALALANGRFSPHAMRARILAIESKVRDGHPGTNQELSVIAGNIGKLAPEEQPLTWLYLDRALAQQAFTNLDFAAAIPPLDHAVAQLALMPEVDPLVEASIHQARTVGYARAGLNPPKLPPLPKALETNVPMRLSMRYAAARVRMIAGEERLLENEYRTIVHELGRTIGPRAEATLLAQHGLAHIYYKQEKWGQCEPLARRTVRAFSDALGQGHVHTRNAANTLASCLVAQGRFVETQAILKPLIALPVPEGKAVKLLQAAIKVNLAHAEAGLANWEQVARLLKEAKQDAGKLLALDSDGVGEVALLEGQLAASRGQKAEARERIETAITQLQKKNPPGFWAVQVAQRTLLTL